MSKSTQHYNLSYLQNSDIWYPNIDKTNMKVIENLLAAAEFFVGDGVLNIDEFDILSNSSVELQRAYYNAAFDYNNELFFNVANNECQFISNNDIVVNLVGTTNYDITGLLSQTIDGRLVRPGDLVFLTSQSNSSENGVYDISLSGAVRKSNQPTKVFVNEDSENYPYSIWMFDDAVLTKTSQNIYDCILVLDGFMGIQNYKTLAPRITCYIKPKGTGAKNLLAIAPDVLYGTGVPILFVSDDNFLNEVIIGSFTLSSTSFSDTYSISSLTSTSESGFLTYFKNQTYEARESYKVLHTHVNEKTKLGFSDLEKLNLVSSSDVSSSLSAIDQVGGIYEFDNNTQTIVKLYINGKEFSTSLLSFNSSSGNFDILVPISSFDQVVMLVTKSSHKFLSPISSDSNSVAGFAIIGSDSSSPYTWNLEDYDNYQLSLDNKSLSQKSYSVDNATGEVTILSQNVNNLPIDNSVIQATDLDISSSKKDISSFYGTTSKVKQVYSNDIIGSVNYTPKHTQFNLTNPYIGHNVVPLIATSNTEYFVPYYGLSGFYNNQPISKINTAIRSKLSVVTTIDNSIFTLINNKFEPIFEQISDKYTQIISIKKINNTDDKFIGLLSNGDTGFCCIIADFETSVFTKHEFKFITGILNDIAAVEISNEIKIFLGASNNIYEADFSSIIPKFDSIYYHLDDGVNSLYSYINSNADQIEISSYNDDETETYEIYAVIDGFPSGQKTCAALLSEAIVAQSTSINLFNIYAPGGLSNNGIVVITPTSTLISTSPASSTMFPLAYGENLQVSSVDVTCVSATLDNIPSFTGASKSLLDYTTLSINDYILVRNQSDATQNGIYKITATTATTFSATKSVVDNVFLGNYVLVQNGLHYANSYWEIDITSDIDLSNLFFRLRSTDLGAGYTTIDHVFSSDANTILLSSPTFCEVVYDSSYVTKDTFKHQNYQVSTSDQILGVIPETKLIISKSNISEDYSNYYLVSSSVFIDYSYPLAQGESIYVRNTSGLQWKVNQLISFTNNNGEVIGVITDISNNSFALEIVSTNVLSLGRATASPSNITLKSTKTSDIFNTEWWSSLLIDRNNAGYLSPLSGSEFVFNQFTRRVILNTGSRFSGSALYGVLDNSKINLQSESDYVFNPQNNTKITYYNTIIGQYNQTLRDRFILEHSNVSPVNLPSNTKLLAESGSQVIENSNSYNGVVSTQQGNAFINVVEGEITSGSTSILDFGPGETIYTTNEEKSISIEDKIFNQNQFSSQTVANSYLLDNALSSALPSYDRFSNSDNIVDILLDPASGSSIQPNASDFESGISNYSYAGGFDVDKNYVSAIFEVSDDLFGVSCGNIFAIDSSDYPISIPVASLEFNYCYDTYVSSSYIYLGTDFGLFVLDYSFNLVSQSCIGKNVTKIYNDTVSGYIFYGVDNSLVAVSESTLDNDSVSLECSHINDISSIEINNPNILNNYILVGTNDGLFGFTINTGESKQGLELLGSNFLAGTKIVLEEVSARAPLSPTNNNLSFIYEDITNNFDEESNSEITSQPNILFIRIDSTRVLLSTDNGIYEYNSLFNLDLDSIEPLANSFEKTQIIFGGQVAVKYFDIIDDTLNLNYSFITTNDGLYLTFDNFNSFIKANIDTRALVASVLNGTWYIGTNNGLFSSSNSGFSYSEIVVPNGFKINYSQSLTTTLNTKNDITVSQINIPIYVLNSGSLRMDVEIYNANPSTGVASGAVLSSSSVDSSYGVGQYVAKFGISGSLSLYNDVNYVFNIRSSTGSNFLIPISNNENPMLEINRVAQNSTVVSINPAIKLCNSLSAQKTSLSYNVNGYRYDYSSNLKKSSSGTIGVYSSAETLYVIDSSKSFTDIAGSVADINNFITSISSVINPKFNQNYSQIIFTNEGITGFTGPAKYVVPTFTGPIGTKTRITDALNASLVRTNSNKFATSSLTTGSEYSSYFTGLTTAERAYPFKGILDSIETLNFASIDFTYDTELFAGLTYNLNQNNYDMAITLNPSGSPANYNSYVFVNDEFINSSLYTLSDNTINFVSVPPSSKTSDVKIYFSSELPLLSSLVSLQNYQSDFGVPLSRFLASTQSKIIIVLSDYIDNSSVSDIGDFVSLASDMYKNYLIVLCGTTNFNFHNFQNLNNRLLIIPKNNTETFVNYCSRVSSLIDNLIHPVFSGEVGIILDKNCKSITCTFSGGAVVYDLIDLYTETFISHGTLTSSVSLNLTQTSESKFLKIIVSPNTTVSQITINKEYETEYLLTKSYSLPTTYNDNLYALTVFNGIGNSKINASSTNSIYKITSFSPGWAFSPSVTPSWSFNSGRTIYTGPSLTSVSTIIASDLQNYTQVVLSEKLARYMPSDAQAIGFMADDQINWDIQNACSPTRVFDPENTTIDEIACVVSTLITDLESNGTLPANTEEEIKTWWSWFMSQNKGKYSYDAANQTLSYLTTVKSTAYVTSPYTASGPSLKFNINGIAGIDDRNKNYYSLQHSLVDYSDLRTYIKQGYEVKIDDTRILKPITTSENQKTLGYSGSISIFGIGNSKLTTNKIIAKLYKINESFNSKVFKPSVPTANPSEININKFKSSNLNIIGLNENFSGSGRKLRFIDQVSWSLTTGSTGPSIFGSTGSSMLYFTNVSQLNNLNVVSQNTVGESNTSSVSTFYLDDNYTPTIDDVTTIINGSSSDSCGLNDKLTINIVINRNDGNSGSPYVYKFNTGDQIIVSVNWYGCKSNGDKPVIISSGQSLLISDSTYNLYKNGYIYAEITSKRGLTVGSIKTSGQIYVI